MNNFRNNTYMNPAPPVIITWRGWKSSANGSKATYSKYQQIEIRTTFPNEILFKKCREVSPFQTSRSKSKEHSAKNIHEVTNPDMSLWRGRFNNRTDNGINDCDVVPWLGGSGGITLERLSCHLGDNYFATKLLLWAVLTLYFSIDTLSLFVSVCQSVCLSSVVSHSLTTPTHILPHCVSQSVS